MKTHKQTYWESLPKESEPEKNRIRLFNIMLIDMFNALLCFVLAGISWLSSMQQEYRLVICIFLLYIAIKDFLVSYNIHRYQ